jgi:hypothetical protein
MLPTILLMPTKWSEGRGVVKKPGDFKPLEFETFKCGEFAVIKTGRVMIHTR